MHIVKSRIFQQRSQQSAHAHQTTHLCFHFEDGWISIICVYVCVNKARIIYVSQRLDEIYDCESEVKKKKQNIFVDPLKLQKIHNKKNLCNSTICRYKIICYAQMMIWMFDMFMTKFYLKIIGNKAGQTPFD